MKHIKYKSLFIAQAIIFVVDSPLIAKGYRHELSTLECLSMNILICGSIFLLAHKINDYFTDDK